MNIEKVGKIDLIKKGLRLNERNYMIRIIENTYLIGGGVICRLKQNQWNH